MWQCQNPMWGCFDLNLSSFHSFPNGKELETRLMSGFGGMLFKDHTCALCERIKKL